MTTTLMNSWKQEVWSKRPEAIWKRSTLLVYDSVSRHINRSILASFKRHYNTTVAVIPGGMTPLLQPADSHWNKPFKTNMRQKWLEWLRSGDREYTRTGKRKRASYEVVAQWVSDAWKEVPQEPIRKSFTECGLFTDSASGNGLECLHSKLRILEDKEALVEEEDASRTDLTDAEDADSENEDGEERVSEEDEDSEDKEN